VRKRCLLLIGVTGLLLAGCGSATTGASTVGRTIAPTDQPASAGQSSPASRAATGGCGPLGLRLRSAAGRGQSLVTGYGRLTGHTRAGYREFELTGLRTLAGPAVPSRLTSWLSAPPGRAAAAADAGGLWAPDGRLVALLTPGGGPGMIASPAPLVGDRVILSAAGCWSDPALTGSRFTGELAEVPGSDGYRLAEQAGGFTNYPLAELSRLAGR